MSKSLPPKSNDVMLGLKRVSRYKHTNGNAYTYDPLRCDDFQVSAGMLVNGNLVSGILLATVTGDDPFDKKINQRGQFAATSMVLFYQIVDHTETVFSKISGQEQFHVFF